MITVISGTNRPNSNTLKVAKEYVRLLQKHDASPKLLSLDILPHDLAFTDLYGNRSADFQMIIDEFIAPANKFVFITPEYNGSFPGVLKLFLDALHPDLNRDKKAALIGVSTGRAGNLRGMDHLTSILNYLSIHVHHDKLPISRVLDLMDNKGAFKDEYTIKVIEKQIASFLKW